jgi:hypothetical protein
MTENLHIPIKYYCGADYETEFVNKKRSISDVLRQELLHRCSAWWPQERNWFVEDTSGQSIQASHSSHSSVWP